MKKINKSIMIVGLIIIGIVLGQVMLKAVEKEHTKKIRVKWEYKIYPQDGQLDFLIEQRNNSSTIDEFISKMNKLGAEGWEIIEIKRSVLLKRRIE